MSWPEEVVLPQILSGFRIPKVPILMPENGITPTLHNWTLETYIGK